MKSDRLLSIVLILLSKGSATGQELADHFEVSLRTIYRDIEKIGKTIVPIGSVSGKGGGYFIMEGFKVDKLFFTKDEIKPMLSVMKGLNAAMGKNNELNNGLRKLQTLYHETAAFDGDLIIDMLPEGETGDVAGKLAIINRAMEENRCIELVYINRNLVCQRRKVEPMKLYYSRGHWFLAGYCRSRSDYREFKLSRMKTLSLGEAFARRDISDEELENLFKRSFVENSIPVVLKFSRRFRDRLTEYFRAANIVSLEDGSALVNINSPDEEGLIKYIMSFGADCEIIEPEWLREKYCSYLQEITRRYQG